MPRPLPITFSLLGGANTEDADSAIRGFARGGLITRDPITGGIMNIDNTLSRWFKASFRSMNPLPPTPKVIGLPVDCDVTEFKINQALVQVLELRKFIDDALQARREGRNLVVAASEEILLNRALGKISASIETVSAECRVLEDELLRLLLLRRDSEAQEARALEDQDWFDLAER